MLVVYFDNEEEEEKIKKIIKQNDLNVANGTVTDYFRTENCIGVYRNLYQQSVLSDRILYLVNRRKDLQEKVIRGTLEYESVNGGYQLERVSYEVSGEIIDKVDYRFEEFDYFYELDLKSETKWVHTIVNMKKMITKNFDF